MWAARAGLRDVIPAYLIRNVTRCNLQVEEKKKLGSRGAESGRIYIFRVENNVYNLRSENITLTFVNCNVYTLQKRLPIVFVKN